MKVATGLRARERVVVHVDSPAARWISALAVLSLSGWLLVLHKDFAWSLTILTAVVLIARGIFLGRPVTAVHATAALVVCIAGIATVFLAFDLLGNLLLVAPAIILMWPTSARPNPADLPRIFALVNATTGDPLAPFAMQASKCYHFTADGTAAIAYRTRLGFAVVSGDPIGDDARFPVLVADFAAMCHTRGWRIVVLGCSERRLNLWSNATMVGQKLHAVPIGRDVVIDVAMFDMVGRKYRNLRQAVQRTHNFGVTTEVVDEQGLSDGLLAELIEVVLASPSGSRTERGFSMALDGTLEGRYPGVALIVARDKDGRVQGFHRYATAGRRCGCDARRAMAAQRRTERYRRAAVRRYDRRRETARGATAVACLCGVSRDLHRRAPKPTKDPGIHGGPSRRSADRAGVAVPLLAQVPRARRSAVCDGNTHAGGAAAAGAAVARVRAAATTPG